MRRVLIPPLARLDLERSTLCRPPDDSAVARVEENGSTRTTTRSAPRQALIREKGCNKRYWRNLWPEANRSASEQRVRSWCRSYRRRLCRHAVEAMPRYREHLTATNLTNCATGWARGRSDACCVWPSTGRQTMRSCRILVFMPSQTFGDVFDQLYFSATSERDKGAKFERFLKRYLEVEPKYADQFSNVWMSQEWPARAGRPDTGIDLVAEDRYTGELTAIQAKFFDPPAPCRSRPSIRSSPSSGRRRSRKA